MWACAFCYKETHTFQTFYYLHIIDIPTNEGVNSYNFEKKDFTFLAPIV